MDSQDRDFRGEQEDHSILPRRVGDFIFLGIGFKPAISGGQRDIQVQIRTGDFSGRSRQESHPTPKEWNKCRNLANITYAYLRHTRLHFCIYEWGNGPVE
jgi:hypothetical protein